jgi:hypothetical protein
VQVRGTWRVVPGELSVSRTLGNAGIKSLVRCQTETSGTSGRGLQYGATTVQR